MPSRFSSCPRLDFRTRSGFFGAAEPKPPAPGFFGGLEDGEELGGDLEDDLSTLNIEKVEEVDIPSSRDMGDIFASTMNIVDSESSSYLTQPPNRANLVRPQDLMGAAAAPILESHACAYRVDLRSEAVRSAMVAVLLVVEQVLLLEYTLTDSVRVGQRPPLTERQPPPRGPTRDARALGVAPLPRRRWAGSGVERRTCRGVEERRWSWT